MKAIKLYEITQEFIYDDAEKEAIHKAMPLALGLIEKDGKTIGTAEQVLELIRMGYARPYASSANLGQLVAVVEPAFNLEELMAQLIAKVAEVAPQNKACNTPQPNDKMLSIRNVQVCGDSIDQLQRELDNGWCILAIQPQPNQRRPDYILGRP